MKLTIVIGIVGLLVQQAQATLYRVDAKSESENPDTGFYTWKIDTQLQSGFAGTLDFSSGGTSFQSVCADVGGNLVPGQTYNFSAPRNFTKSALGSMGSMPTWGTNGQASQAIRNAAFLFYNNQNLLGGTKTDQAALQLAIWGALYNTGGSLTLDDRGQRFWVSGQSAAKLEAEELLLTLQNADTAIVGALLQPLLPNGGVDIYAQEVFAPRSMADQPPTVVVAAVPEASTLVAGMLLVAPLGLSVARRLRRQS